MDVSKHRPRFAGLPLTTWGFALRSWIAMVLALYIAMWLQLQGGSDAAITVGILAMPTRGPSYAKAFYRLVGTVVGLSASITLAGMFNETRTLFLGALSIWFALCVFVAGLFDGNRSYAAVLSGYTVAIVAVPDIDVPLQTFASAVDRGAAIVLGIVVLTIVFDLFSPDSLPELREKIGAMHAKVSAFASTTLSGTTPSPVTIAELYGEITALRAGALAISTESISGEIRAAAARRAVAALTAQVRDALDLVGAPADLRSFVVKALGRVPLREQEVTHAAALRLLDDDKVVRDALGSLASGYGSKHGPDLPIHHSAVPAARNAFRALAAFVVGSAFFVVSGWPATTEGLLHIAIFTCLSVTMPNARTYAFATALGTVFVIAAVGVTEFLILDGMDAFPLLAIAMIPTVVPASMMKTSANHVVSTVGQRTLIYFFVLLSPGLSQNYDPQNFVSESIILLTSAFIFIATRTIILPLHPRLRRGWLLSAARRRLRASGRGEVRSRLEDAYWWADLLAQMGKLVHAEGDVSGGELDLEEALGLSTAVHRVATG